jgi:thioredoxin-related protein
MTLRALLLAPLLLLSLGGAVHAENAPAAKASTGAAAAPAKAIQWVSLDEAMKKATASGKYVFVAVYTDWCGYCRKLNNTTFRAQPVINELGKNFQSVRVNAESPKAVMWKGKKLTERQVAGDVWGVTGYPTMLFLSPKGEIIGSYAAYADTKLMVNLLTYISSGAREKNVSFDDFLEGKG